MGRRHDLPGEGWFEIDGLQRGQRRLAEQMTGLRPLLDMVAGASVLDLGCAEGLISLELMKAGAAKVHGVEYVQTRIDTARRFFDGRDAEFFQADLARFPVEVPAGLLPSYDVVLMLSIIHKFATPEQFLRGGAARAGRLAAIRLPSRVLSDRRSGFRQVDIPALMAACGFRQIHDAPGPQGEWVGLFERT